jgi:flagellar biosynthesis protein FliR
MELHVNIGWMLTVLLVSVRVAAATALVSVFGPAQIPSTVKVIVTLSLSVCLVTTSTQTVPSDVLTTLGLAAAVIHEAMIGVAFSLGFLVAYSATQVAGRLLDVQIGFGAASILNPATQGMTSLLGALFGTVMIATFLAMDGHHELIRALSISLQAAPVGVISTSSAEGAFEHSAVMFVYGLALASPVMFALWLTDIAMAVFARSMPQLNVFVLSFAVKIVLGISGLALSLAITRNLFADLLNSVFVYWRQLAVAH